MHQPKTLLSVLLDFNESPGIMEYLYGIVRDCGVLFRKNLRAEYEANPKLRNACASFVGSYIEYRNAIKSSKPFVIGNKIVSSSIGIMKLSDAFIKFYLCTNRFPRFSKGIGLLQGQGKIQKRLDMLFVIPQYYGGIKDTNIAFYKKLCGRIGTTSSASEARALDVYRPTIKKRILNIISRFKSVFDFGGQEDSTVMEIENYLLPEIFKNVNSPQELSRLCSEEGVLDLKQLMSEVEREFGEKDINLRVIDLRRIETSDSLASDNEECFESQFELEIEAVCNSTQRHSIYIVLANGRFTIKNENSDKKWKLSGLTWSRLN